jgi:PKD repeat protein
MGPLFMPMSQAPEAGFDHNGPVVLGDTAVFTNTTSGVDPITYTWNFGDNSPLSDLENPTHDYAAVGDFTVTLTATNETGTDVVSHTLQVGIAPKAIFTSPVSAPVYQPITFTNLSEGTPPLSFTWEFGDETSSSDENPSHVYTEAGQYVVTLTTTSPFGSDTNSSTITIEEAKVAPTAVFTHSLPVSVGNPVQFTNESYGTSPITYTWDFGDKSPITTTVNPSHTYMLTGTFTITLTATNEFGSSVAVRVVNVVLLDNFVYLPVAIREEIVPEN